jgi:hypothetical protein
MLPPTEGASKPGIPPLAAWRTDMANVFVRHQGKVFGPLTPHRAEELLKSGTFDATTEFGPAWDGPWGPLLDLPVSSAQSRPEPPIAPRRVEAKADHATPPPDEDPLAFPGDGNPADDVFANLGLPHESPRPRFHRLKHRAMLTPVVISGVVLFFVTLVLAILVAGRRQEALITDNRPSDVAEGSRAVGLEVRKTEPERQATSSLEKSRGHNLPSSSTLSTGNTSRPTIAAANSSSPKGPRSSGTASDDASFVTPNVASRYEDLPDDARAAIKAIRSLKASVDIGIDFKQYSEKLQELLPPVKLFLESHEAGPLPELKTFLHNAMDCYVQVKTLWSESIFADSPAAKARATELFALARAPLWQVAATNVQAAHDLTNPDAAVQLAAISKLATAPDALAMQPELTEAKRRLVEKRATLAERVEEDASAGVRTRVKHSQPVKAFDRRHIDIKALRASLEAIDKESLSKQDATLIESFLSLTRSREWIASNRDKAWGDPLTIRPEAVQLDLGKRGVEFVPRDRMSDASLAIVSRIEELAEQAHALQQRLLHDDGAE